ncbi:MAG: OmpW family protein [Tenericutes bacterium]|nr:MAG: OmpW family protein [Mycoplasmatota bacterium]
MKATKLAVALLAAMGISTVAMPVMAYEAGDWLVRGRIVNVDPQDSSGRVSVNGTKVPGSGVNVNSDVIPELDITYMVSRNWGVELILGYSEHDVTGSGSVAGLGRVIEAKALPPTLTVQYHFAPDSNIRPYIGAGVNYTYFWDEDVKGILNVPGAKVEMDDSWGLAAQAGMDIAINDDWFVNVDIKYIQMDTTAKFKNTLVGSAKVDVDIDPLVYGVGIGRRF